MGLYQSVYSIGIVAGYFALKVEIGVVFILSAFLLLLGGILSLVESLKLSKGKVETGGGSEEYLKVRTETDHAPSCSFLFLNNIEERDLKFSYPK